MLVVGGGPVGLTLAIDLASRGIDVVVAELREAGEPPSVKCNHVSARSMEIYRRLGLARKLRDAGLPPDFPNDAVYRTTATTGAELSRIPIPCRRDRYIATSGPDTWWPTPEPPHRINQIFMEPVLFEHARGCPGVTHPEPHLGRELHAGRARRASRRCAISTPARRSTVAPTTWWAAMAAAPWCAGRSARRSPARR